MARIMRECHAADSMWLCPPPPYPPHSRPMPHQPTPLCRRAFADARWYVADPAATEVPVAGMLDDGYAQSRVSDLDPARATADVEKGQPPRASCTVSFQVWSLARSSELSQGLSCAVACAVTDVGICCCPLHCHKRCDMRRQLRRHMLSLTLLASWCLTSGPYVRWWTGRATP
jgi:hypothetical protein